MTTILLVLAILSAEGRSYEEELALRRAAVASRAASKHEARLKRMSRYQGTAKLELDRIARMNVNTSLQYRGPQCHASRYGRIAAQKAYYRQLPAAGPLVDQRLRSVQDHGAIDERLAVLAE